MSSAQPEHTDSNHPVHRVLDSLWIALPPMPPWPDLN
jgi:hypothetical protein